MDFGFMEQKHRLSQAMAIQRQVAVRLSLASQVIRDLLSWLQGQQS